MTAPSTTLRHLVRGARAETIRLGGPRGPLLLAVLPGAVLLPLLVTFGVATVAERFSALSSDIQVTSVGTSNSVYWVITFTVMVWAVVAATAQASSAHGSGSDLQHFLLPRPWTSAAARWLVYGAAAAGTALLLVAVVMIVLPAAFPTVYGAVDVGSAVGLRFVWAVPVYAVAACGIGVGLGALIGRPVPTAVVLFGWAFVVENAIALIPNGYSLQGYMPFLNGQFGTGQELAFTPPWGAGGALLYVFAVAAAVFAIGCVAARLRRRR